MSRGALIVLEGVDRSGKSTQTLKLIESLAKRNIRAERMCFPDRTTWTGQVISQYLGSKECKLNDEAIHLLFSANRWENLSKIEDRLKKGVTLIVDRYSYSGVAFSVAKGMEMNWCMNPEIGLPKPDVVYLLNMNPEHLKDRPGFGEERYESISLQTKVSEVFKTFATTEDNWKVVDANRSFETIHSELLSDIAEHINKIEQLNTPLGYFKSDRKASAGANVQMVMLSPEKRQKVV